MSTPSSSTTDLPPPTPRRDSPQQPAPPTQPAPPRQPAPTDDRDARTRERTTEPHDDRRWRERLPELIGGIGVAFVLLALAGFLSSGWEQLGGLGRSAVLAACASALTAAALWLEHHQEERMATLTSLLWVAATATVAGAATLAATAGGAAPSTWPRGATTIGGLAALAHAGVGLHRERRRVLRQLGVIGAAVFAIGPPSQRAWGAVLDTDPLLLLRPLEGFFDPTVTDERFVLVGVLHALVGVAWLTSSRVLEGRAGHAAAIGGTVVLGLAALELNVIASPLGALAALLIVLGYLVHGLVTDRIGLVVTGVFGTIVAAVRVVFALFSGEVAVTVAAFVVGLAMLAWAVRARSRSET